MPCRADYMELHECEINSQQTAFLIRYLNNRMKKDTPEFIHKIADSAYGDCTELNSLVIELCAMVRSLSKEQMDEWVYNGRNKVARQMADWWDKHNAADKAREAEELQIATLKNIAVKVLTALSPMETESLRRHFLDDW